MQTWTGGNRVFAQGVTPKDIATRDCTEIKKDKEVCRKCYLSGLLRKANNGQYIQLKVDRSNNMTKGTDNFPKTIFETMHLLTNYLPPPRLQCACTIRMARDWPLYKAGAEHCTVQRGTAPTRKSSAGTAANRTTKTVPRGQVAGCGHPEPQYQQLRQGT